MVAEKPANVPGKGSLKLRIAKVQFQPHIVNFGPCSQAVLLSCEFDQLLGYLRTVNA
jgi:hypothetical protein